MELKKDLRIIAEDIKQNEFENNSILVTGSTGLIGSLIVKGFLEANKIFGLNNKVFALARNTKKAQAIFKEYLSESNLKIIENEITETINIEESIDYIYHTACVTTSKEMITYPVEIIKTSVNGTVNVLDFARSHKTKSVVYLSSMEVYGVIDASNIRLEEGILGDLDLTSVRSCYPESKRLNELLCKCYSSEYGLNVCSARLTQTFGAGASIEDNRIFAYIAKSAINNENVVLKSSGKSAHDYCYTTDAVSAILLLSKKGTPGDAYNIANEETFSSIYDMASLVLNTFSPGKTVIVENNDNKMFSKDSIIKLDTQKIRNLGWNPKVNLIEMYEKLIKSYKEL